MHFTQGATMMKKFPAAPACVALLVLAVSGPANAQTGVLANYQAQVKEAGFEPVYPATDGPAPGQIYFVDRTGRLEVPNTICEALFVTPNPKPENTSLKSIKAANTNELSAGFSVAPDAIKNVVEASATLKSGGAKSGDMSFTGPQIAKVPARVSKTGDKRQILPACKTELASLFDENGKPTREIYVISRTLSVSGIDYKVSIQKNKEAGLKAVLQKLFTFNFGYKKTSDTSAALTFKPENADDRRVVGVNRTLVTTLAVETLVADKSNAFIAGTDVPVTSDPVRLPRRK